jgi:hypothetical protein
MRCSGSLLKFVFVNKFLLKLQQLQVPNHARRIGEILLPVVKNGGQYDGNWEFS